MKYNYEDWVERKTKRQESNNVKTVQENGTEVLPMSSSAIISQGRYFIKTNYCRRELNFSRDFQLFTFLYAVYFFLAFLCGRLLSAVLSLFKSSELKSQYFLHYFQKFTLPFFLSLFGKILILLISMLLQFQKPI